MKLCKICGKQTISYRHPRFDMVFHECQYCGFIFKDEANYVSLREEIKKYDEHHNEDDNMGYVNFLTDFIEAAVLPYIQTGKALDFGSGPNPVLSKIMRNSYGFDVDIYDLYYAKEKVYKNQVYDLITSTEVVEHLKSPMDAFILFYKHLKPGGILSIMTLFHPRNKEMLFDWFYIRDKTHVSFYTVQTMRIIAEKFNFEFIETNDYRYTVFRKKAVLMI
ncbi:MAG: class I SAM-dependent methyltransferase [Bacillota bacterium]